MPRPRLMRDAPILVIALTAESASAAIQLKYTTFMDLVHRGEIPFIVVGGGRHRQHRRFLPEDLRAWAMRNRVPARWEADEQSKHGHR